MSEHHLNLHSLSTHSPLRAWGFLLCLASFVIKKKGGGGGICLEDSLCFLDLWIETLSACCSQHRLSLVKWCYEGQLGQWKACDDPGMFHHNLGNASTFSLSLKFFSTYYLEGFFHMFTKLCTLLEPDWLMLVWGEQSFHLPWTLESSFR